MARPAGATKDKDLLQVEKALAPFKRKHSRAVVEVRRRSDVSIRIRIVEPSFKKLDLVEREEVIWPLIEKLPEDIATQITMLILITPDEKESSFASMEFDDPTPWPEVTSSR